MIASLRTFWNERSGRERLLLGAMLALAGAMFLWFGVARPLIGARVKAETRLANASEEAGLIAGRASLRTGAAYRGGVAPVALTRTTATSAGFSPTRVDPEGPDGVAIAIPSARAPALFAWLARLEAQGLRVATLDLRANADGTLAAKRGAEDRAVKVARAQIAAFIGVALLSLIAFFPLALAIPLFGFDDMVTARRAEGPVWSGKLHDARIGGMPVGTVGLKLRILPLLTGRARVDIWNPSGIGAVSAWPGGRGIDDVTASLPLAAVAGQIPVDRAMLEDATVHFSGTRCTRADGRVRLTMRYPLTDGAPPPILSGTLRCDGDAATARLADPSGAILLTLRLTSDGGYAGRLSGQGMTMRIGGRL